VNAAYLLNIHQGGLDACFPYVEGCLSVSRGLRSGPGLLLFRAMAVPTALCMAGTWAGLPPGLRGRAVPWIGMVGVAFFLLYAFTLGSDGELYRWMRRYGVVFYFGLTGLAQLLVAAQLWARGQCGSVRATGARTFTTMIVATWAIGVLSAFKRQLIDDPEVVDRFQNALEWDFALALSLTFMAMALLMRRRVP